MPECWLVIAMCAVVLVPFINRRSVLLPTVTTLIGLGLALVWAMWTAGAEASTVFADTRVLAIDPFSQFFKVILLLFTMLIIVQWLLNSRDRMDARDVPDFQCLLLGAAVGMALMASANNLLMIFVATEAASLPSFALAGFRKKNALSTEGSLKYVVFGSAASAISIYGMSLIYGSTGALGLAEIAAHAAAPAGMTPLLAIGLLAMFAGVAFKLSAVPLHFWCPDVFQGAPIEVTTFLSVASKGAAVCLLVRIMAAFGAAGEFVGLATGIGILGALTATWGNLAAFHQNNIKRLLAYSSIAHAGYMIMAAAVLGVAGEMVTVGDEEKYVFTLTQLTPVTGALLFYLFVYTFMNLGAFTVAALIARRTGSEDIRDYAGLSKRAPWLAGLLALFLLSLFGMPGLGGFLGKVLIGIAMGEAGGGRFLLLAALLINTLISLYFYLRPVYQMYFAGDDQDRPRVTMPGAVTALLAGCAILLVATGLGFMSGPAARYAAVYGVASADDSSNQPPTAAAEPAGRVADLSATDLNDSTP